MVKKRKLPPHIVLPNGQWRFVKRGRKHRVKKRGVRMVRHRYRRHKNGGINSILKAAVFGAIGGAIAPKVPLVNNLPMSRAVGGAGAAYLLSGKSMKNVLIGAAAGQFLGSTLGGAVGTGTSSAW